MLNMWLFYGWIESNLWHFPIASAVAENASMYGDRHKGNADTGGSSGGWYP